MEFKHVSVLLEECLEALNIKKDGTYVDCTLGGAGHSKEILKRIETGKLIGIDQDQDALHNAKTILSQYSNVILVHSNFEMIKSIIEELKTMHLKVLMEFSWILESHLISWMKEKEASLT